MNVAGALSGVRIIEFAGIGPGPFCGMMLADHGAEVIRVDRPGASLNPVDALSRSRRSIVIDMKQPAGIALARELCQSADGLIEGYRPGVMERLGMGPEVLLALNPKLVYGRMTGWGQTGPLSRLAGHDINYIAISGVLHTIGVAGGKPVPPVNYIGDFGGGGMLLAFGMVSGLLAVRMGQPGQVIDAAMVEGAGLIACMTWAARAAGFWEDRPGVNMLDGGAHFYDTYECADGRYIAIGAIEPAFYAALRARIGLADDAAFDAQMDRSAWPDLKARLATLFLSRKRDEWCALLDGTDACASPVLSLAEALVHPHNVARGSFVQVNGAPQPAPAPRFGTTPAPPPRAAGEAGADILADLGFDPTRIAALQAEGVLG